MKSQDDERGEVAQEPIRQALLDLCAYHDRAFSDKAIGDYEGQLSSVKIGELRSAISRWKQEHPPSHHLPSIVELLKLVYDVRYARQKEERLPHALRPREDSRESEMAADFNRLMSALVSKKITQTAFILGIESMAERWPRAGWRETAASYRKIYAEELMAEEEELRHNQEGEKEA